MQLVRKILLGLVALLISLYAGMVIYAYWPAAKGVPAEELATADDRFATVDGIRLRYRLWGDQALGKPTLVLIHGFANTLQTFQRIAPFLAKDYTVIALDMPGFGLSDKPVDHDYSNPSQAAVVTDFIAELGLQDVVVGGHSMGGAHALHVALNSPAVVGMLLFNPGIITTGVPAATEYLVFPFPRLAAKTFGDREFRRNFLVGSYIDPTIVTDEVMDDIMLGAQTDDYITGTTALMSYYVSGDEVSLLDKVECRR